MPRRVARTGPRGPLKVPRDYVFEKLIEYHDDNPDELVEAPTQRYFNRHAVNDGVLFPVGKLKHLFRHARTFQEFKRTYLHDIPNEEWLRIVDGNPRLQTYARRFMSGAASNRRFLRLKAYVDHPDSYLPDDPSSEDSVMSIDQKNDECDNTNVNLPKSVCQGIRRVCRYHDENRRYRPFDKDDSERHRYNFNVSYV